MKTKKVSFIYKKKHLKVSLIYKKGGKENGRHFWRGYYVKFELVDKGKKTEENFELMAIAKKYSEKMYETIKESMFNDCNVQGYINYFLETGKIN